MRKHSGKLIIILAISFIMNILMSYINYGNRYRIGENSYFNTEIIKQKNEKNLDIIRNSIESKRINNSELLTLYTNYIAMSDSLVELLNDYVYYSQDKYMIFNKNKINNDVPVKNEVYSRISIYLENSLVNIMNTNKNNLDLSGKTLEDFKTLDDMCVSTKELYETFDKEKLNNVDGEERKKKIIDKKYWIDIMEGLNNINSKYNDYDFTKEVSKVSIQ